MGIPSRWAGTGPVATTVPSSAVISTTIDKYCYLSVRYLPPFFEHKYRVVWSYLENQKCIDDIQHPVVREVLEALGKRVRVIPGPINKALMFTQNRLMPVKAVVNQLGAFMAKGLKKE